MADPRVVQTAFKEWSAVIRGLEEGDQICLIRKGKQDEKRFPMENRRFWLIPTYKHQSEDMIQPFYREYLDDTEEEREEAGENGVRMQSWAEAKTLLKIRKNERLNWLTDYVVYSPRCLQTRFQLQPNEAVHMLIARIYSLPDPRVLPSKPEYSNCTDDNPEGAWTQIDQRIPLQADNPAVGEAEFQEQKEEIRQRFIRDGDDSPRPMMF